MYNIEINKYTPLRKILIAYPQLIDRLIERNRQYSIIDDKYSATVAVAANICKEDVDELLEFIKKEIEKIDIQYRY